MAKLSSKNQITIPVDVLRELGLRAGDEVVVSAVNGHIEVTPRPDWIEEFAGSMPGVWPGGDAVEYVRELRREWDR